VSAAARAATTLGGGVMVQAEIVRVKRAMPAADRKLDLDGANMIAQRNCINEALL
jgi:hypothetical protein